MAKFYVTMTDRFMSAWGRAEGRISKLVFECDSYEEAEVVERNAKDRSEMIRVNVRATRPRYSEATTVTSWKTKEEAPVWYRADRPFKG